MFAQVPFYGRFRRWDIRGVAAVFLANLYTARYLGYPGLPGNNPRSPAGWWAWFDQSHYIDSARAFARFSLDPSQHYYPPGYALLGAMFVRISAVHPFFFVDLAALLVSFAAFLSVAQRCGLGPGLGSAMFVLGTAVDPKLFAQWVVPWTTTPLAAALWVLLALAAAYLEGVRRPFWLGFACACLPILRPTDTLLAGPAVAFCVAAEMRAGRLRLTDVGRFALGAAGPACLYAALYLGMYGLHASEYFVTSARLGFSLHEFGWKAYVVLIEPSAWFGSGEGLLRREPWVVLGVAGLVPAARRRVPAMVAATLVLHTVLYLAYVDLLPTNLWHYMTVRYWGWAFPACALLAALLVRDLLRAGTRRVAAAGLAAAVLLLCVRYDPVKAQPGQTVEALDFAGPVPSLEQAAFDDVTVTDAEGTQANVTQVRAVPMPFGTRVLALRRPFDGPASATGALAGVTPMPIHAALRFGLPRWRAQPRGDPYGPQ